MPFDPLPPLNALRAFEAAARHKSFTKAANELNMTQAAVSYQIKQLEDRFGDALFVRGVRQVSLSEAGARLAPQISEAFEIIRRSFAEAKGEADNLLTITTWQTFASSWLAKHLGSFQIYCGDFAVKLDITNQTYDSFRNSGVDVAIRTGTGNWPGMISRKIMGFDYTPMLSPKLLDRLGPLEKPEDLLNFPMVAPNDPWWSTWFEAMGVDTSSLERARGPALSTQHIHGVAAISGDSVAMLTPCLYQDELSSGTLIQPFEHVELEQLWVWLCYPKEHKNRRKVALFEEWLFEKLDETMPNRAV